MRARVLAVSSAAVLSIATLAGCGGGGTTTDHLTVQEGPLGAGNAITPASLKAHKGDKVEIKVTNTATDKPHGFSIDGYNVVRTVDAGKTETISFTADKSGTFRVFCQLHPAHKPSELVVT